MIDVRRVYISSEDWETMKPVVGTFDAMVGMTDFRTNPPAEVEAIYMVRSGEQLTIYVVI